MRKIIYVLLLMVIISCNPRTWYTIGNGENMKHEFACEFNKEQFDSACFANKIDCDLKKWMFLPLVDEETKENNGKYMFIQKMDSLEIIYTVLKKKNKYNLNKRITY